MEKLTVKLRVEEEPGNRGDKNSLRRRKVLEFKEFPGEVALGGQGLFSLVRKEEGCLVCPAAGVCLQVNAKEVSGEQRLSPGDKISANGYCFGYYIQYPPCAVSRACTALSFLSKLGAALFLVLELWIVCGLPMQAASSGLLGSAVQKQQMDSKLDALRTLAASVETDDPFAESYLMELRTELDDRARYLRTNGENMRRRHRREMYSDLLRVEKILQKLKEGASLGAVPVPDIDQAVQRILNEQEVSDE